MYEKSKKVKIKLTKRKLQSNVSRPEIQGPQIPQNELNNHIHESNHYPYITFVYLFIFWNGNT